MRRAAKIDINHPEIVAAFRKLGYSVRSTATIGQGFPDLAVGKFGRTFLVEVKDGMQSPSRRKLTPDEVEFHRDWQGHVCIIQNLGEVEEFNRKHSR